MVASPTVSLAKSKAEIFVKWKAMPLSISILPSSLANLEPMLTQNPMHSTKHYNLGPSDLDRFKYFKKELTKPGWSFYYFLIFFPIWQVKIGKFYIRYTNVPANYYLSFPSSSPDFLCQLAVGQLSIAVGLTVTGPQLLVRDRSGPR